jgi:hypothetical protein
MIKNGLSYFNKNKFKNLRLYIKKAIFLYFYYINIFT